MQPLLVSVSTSTSVVLVIWTDQTSECYRVHLSHGPCDGPKQDTSYSISEERVIAVPLGDTGPQGSYCYEVGFETSEGVLIGGTVVAGTVGVQGPSTGNECMSDKILTFAFQSQLLQFQLLQ